MMRSAGGFNFWRKMLPKRFTYSTYGISLTCDIQLPDLIEAETGTGDVDVSFRCLERDFINSVVESGQIFHRPSCTVRVSPQAVHYRWEGIGEALVRNGREILISPESGVSREDLAPFITGALIGNLLDQRGLIVFHGSAVVAHGKAIVFLGDQGAGKSTIALQLQMLGLPLVSDDLIPVSLEAGRLATSPGFPRIKLWKDSIASVGLDPAGFPTINSFVRKHSYSCGNGFGLGQMEIGQMYVLAEGDHVTIEELNGQTAFIELLRNIYLHKFLNANGRLLQYFRMCELLSKSIPVFRLSRPRDFEHLAESASMVLNNFAPLPDTV